MNVTYSEKAKQVLGEAEVTRTNAIATKVLEEYPFLPFKANWDVAEDANGRFVYTIQADDPEETVRETLEPDEVKSDHHFRARLYLLMNALLRQRSKKRIRFPLKPEDQNGQED